MSNSDILDFHLVAIGLLALVAGVLAFLGNAFSPAYVIVGALAFLVLFLKEHRGLIKAALARKQ